jgi:hypothetical protein
MGFLDKLLGRKPSDSGERATTPQPTSMPTDDAPEHSHGEDEHSHEHDEDSSAGPPA